LDDGSLEILSGISADGEFDGYDGCCGARLDLLMGGGLPMVAEPGPATGDEVELLEFGVWVSRSDFGAGGPK
jgi:hypothetical protein